MTAPRQLSDALPSIERQVSRKGVMFGRPNRRRKLYVVALILLALGLPIVVAGQGAAPREEAAAATAPADPDDADLVSAGDVEPASGPQAEQPDIVPFARYQDLELSLPADDVLLVGFHEASFPESLQLEPVGRCTANENPTEAVCPPDAEGPEYVVLSSRGRSTLGTTAVDLVIQDGVPVLSPVSGTVVDVRPYALYGKYPDHRIEIVPSGRPDLRMVLIHVNDVFIQAGDAVVAGETQIAGGPNRFPFGSHIDRYFPQDRWPHVHIEVKPAG